MKRNDATSEMKIIIIRMELLVSSAQIEINSGNAGENVDDGAHHQNDGLRQILFVFTSVLELLKFNRNATDVQHLIHLTVSRNVTNAECF